MDKQENQFLPIRTKRLLIREFKEDDAFAYFDLFSNSKVIEFLPIELFHEINEAKIAIKKICDEYQKGLFLRLAVEEIATKECIGYIGLSRFVQKKETCEVVYAYRETFWRKGYAKEALLAYIPYLEKTNKTIIGGHVASNIGSGIVLERCGLIRRPDLDTKMMIHGKENDIYNYAKERKENK